MFNLNSNQKVLTFIILVLASAILFAYKGGIFIELYMFIPLIVSLTIMFLFTKDGYKKDEWKKIGIHKLDFKSIFLALIIPSCVLIFSYFLYQKFFNNSYIGLNGYKVFDFPSILIIIKTTFVYILYQTITMSLGEEFGRRGYFQTQVLNVFSSPIKAYIFIGIIWATWHLPLILSGNYFSGGNLVFNIILFFIVVIILSIFFGKLKDRKGSLWPAVIFHSTHNTLNNILGMMFISSPTLGYLSGENGIFTILLYLIFLFFMLKILGMKKN